MSKIVKIEVENGLSFWAEVDEVREFTASTSSSDPNLPPGASPTGFADDVQKSAAMAKQTVKAVVAYVKDSFTEFNSPDELQLEFNLTLKGSGGIPVLAQQSAEASLKITAKWVRTPENDAASSSGDSTTEPLI